MNKLVNISLKVYKSKFLNIIVNTLRVIFPIILVGSFAEVIKFSFLRPDGFISSVFGSNHWFMFSEQLTYLMGMIYHSTIDMIALYAAFAACYYTVKEYDESHMSAGLIGGCAFLVLTCEPLQNGGFTFSHYMMTNGMFIGVILGYVCGRILLKFNLEHKNYSNLIWPLAIIFIVCSLLNLLFYFIGALQIPTYTSSYVTAHSASSSLGYVLGMGFLTDVMSWLAMGGPFVQSPTFTDTASVANLQHALRVGSAWNAPYKFTDTTLFHSYANFGGSGVTLALIIAILLFSKRKNYRTVSKWAIFPAIFNNHYPMMLGIPILYNPIYFLPFVFAPLINMFIASLFTALNWVPAAVYSVPVGTPGPLIAFIGTGGNWLALLLGCFLIAIDVLIYIPFVKMADQLRIKAGEK